MSQNGVIIGRENQRLLTITKETLDGDKIYLIENPKVGFAGNSQSCFLPLGHATMTLIYILKNFGRVRIFSN